MLTRLWLILLLVWAPIPIGSAGSHASQTAVSACETTRCCCRTIERTTCCGMKLVERVCAKTGGECRCAKQDEDRGPAPETPLPRTDREPVVAVVMWSGVSVRDGAACAWRRPCGAPEVGRFASLSHNEVCALLGVWRT